MIYGHNCTHNLPEHGNAVSWTSEDADNDDNQERRRRMSRAALLALDLGLIVQDRVQQRSMHFHLSVVADEAQFAEFVQEETNA